MTRVCCPNCPVLKKVLSAIKCIARAALIRIERIMVAKCYQVNFSGSTHVLFLFWFPTADFLSAFSLLSKTQVYLPMMVMFD